MAFCPMFNIQFQTGTTPKEVFRQLQSQGVTKVDAMSSAFSISAFHAIPTELQNAAWRLLLPASVLDDWAILDAEKDRTFLNKLTLPHLAAECLKWVDNPDNQLRFSQMPPGMSTMSFTNGGGEQYGILGNCSLTTDGMGITPATTLGVAMPMVGSQVESFSTQFDAFWNMSINTTITEFRNRLHFLAEPHPPTWVYYKTCHTLLKSTDNPDDYIKPETGFYDSCVWKKLYSFQRDGVRAVITKLLKHNGCILADSVGLGKTFEALAVIKYFQLRGDNILVLCPKRLRANWDIYTQQADDRNVLAKDKLRYTVLHHTDINRTNGVSGTVDLEHINWGMFDLVVIDESHNFRNRPTHQAQGGNRYDLLMEKIIKSGVPTKVLMLSATPVNNRVSDIRNQIAFITGNDDGAFAREGIESIELTARRAQGSFNQWLGLPNVSRTTSKLLSLLGQDYFQLLDMLTIARSRRHIERYYKGEDSSLGQFPERREPINLYPDVASASLFPPIEEVNNDIARLHMAAYNPLAYIKQEKKDVYMQMYTQAAGTGLFRQADRDQSVSNLIRVNLLKRMESSIQSFRLTVKKQLQTSIALRDKLQRLAEAEFLPEEYEDEDDDVFDEIIQRGKVKVRLADVDCVRWIAELEEDIDVLSAMGDRAKLVTLEQDCKLAELKRLIEEKVKAPINEGNRKMIIFSAFADTTEYLYEELAPWVLNKFGMYTAMVTGSRKNSTNLNGIRLTQDTLLSHFSPRSKELPAGSKGEIDILIATDCISEGQNLQDCDYLVNYDIHWNPVRIIQRFGRIDRLGSTNKSIQLVNFWPTKNLNAYINLENRVKGRMVLLDIAATGDENIVASTQDKAVAGELQTLSYRLRQLKRLQNEVVDLEDVDGGLSITDLNMESYRADLNAFNKLHPDMVESWPSYFSATLDVTGMDDIKPGAFFCLCSHSKTPPSPDYPLAPYYVIHVAEDGGVSDDYKHVKMCLDLLKKAVWDYDSVSPEHVKKLNAKTRNGADMSRYTKLLAEAVNAVMGREKETTAASIFSPGGTTLGTGSTAKGVDDFEVVAMLTLTRS